MDKFHKIILTISIVIVVTQFILGLFQPLWLDEVSTFFLVDVNTIGKLLQNLYVGVDTHPPLYFSLVFLLKVFSGENLIVFKLLSLFLSLSGVVYFYFNMKKYFKQETWVILFFLLSLTPFFSHFLIREIRPYSLYFCLALFFIVHWQKYRKLEKPTIKNIFCFSIIITLLLYTHYFTLIYLFGFFSIEFYYAIREKRFVKIIPFFISFVLFIPGMMGMHNQINSVHGFVWQDVPSFLQLVFLPRFFFKFISVIFLFFTFTFFFQSSRKTLYSFFKKNTEMTLIMLITVIVPIVIYLFSQNHTVVFVERYFVISYIGCVLFFGISYEVLPNKFKKIVFIFTFLFGTRQIYHYYNDVQFSINKIHYYQNLNTLNTPILCEGVLEFYPAYFYTNKDKSSNFFYVLDEEAAKNASNSNKLQFDYYWNKNMKEYYTIPHFMEWEENQDIIKKFYVFLNRKSNFFEYRIKNNPSYTWNKLDSNVVYVTRN